MARGWEGSWGQGVLGPFHTTHPQLSLRASSNHGQAPTQLKLACCCSVFLELDYGKGHSASTNKHAQSPGTEELELKAQGRILLGQATPPHRVAETRQELR